MVIRTEYRSQRYSMGSSDPLPAGFEIQFGSLNFQATGNGYLIRITNRVKLHPWRSTGPGPVPVTPAADARRPPRRTLWALQRPDADGTPASARTKRRWNDVRPRVSPYNAMHLPARRRRHPRRSAWLPSRGSPTGCATSRQRMPRLPAPTWRRTSRGGATGGALGPAPPPPDATLFP
jgi:hypothetical protein